MAKIIKNTTLADIELTKIGLTIPASGQVTISEKDYIQLSTQDAISQISPLINSGNIVINDGINDISVSEALDFLRFPDDAISIRFLSQPERSNGIVSKTVQGAVEETSDLLKTHASRHLPNGADPLTTASAVTLSATTTNAQGNGNSFARSNHTHQLLTGAPSQQTPDQANSTGTSSNLARADHIHNIPTATAVTVLTSSTNTQGNSTSFARANHTHKVEIPVFQALENGEVQTNSTNDVLLTSMTLTPPSGTYLLDAVTTFQHFNATRRVFFSIYVGGTQVSNSLTEMQTGSNNQARDVRQTWCFSNSVTANGSQSVEIRWRSSSGTARAFLRSLRLTRIS